jgi:GGDEF domain-containing protein
MAGAVAGYALVFVALAAYGKPGLGIGQLFYLPISLAALAGTATSGAVAGVVAITLYELALLIGSGNLDAATTPSAAIHFTGYVAVGLAVGAFARRARRLLADALVILDELLAIARRDTATGLADSRGFDELLATRVRRNSPFVLLLGEPASRTRHDDALRKLAATIAGCLPGADVARIAPDQFALIVSAGALGPGRETSPAAERAVHAAGAQMTFGWASWPADGSDVYALFAVASRRLHERKFARGEWSPTPATAGLVEVLRRPEP